MSSKGDMLGRVVNGDAPREDFCPKSDTSNVGFDTFDSNPPGLTYITLQDRLLVAIANLNSSASPHTLTLRILRPDGQIIMLTFTPATGNGVFVTSLFDLVEGFLLDCTLTSNNSQASVRTYAFVALARGSSVANAVVGQVLAKGYYNASVPLAYPWSYHEPTVQNQGLITSVQIGNPAAGAQAIHTVPLGFRERVISLSFLFTTAVAVATRDVVVVITDGANTLGQFPANVSQAASLAIQYTASAAPYGSAIVANEGQIALPPDLRLAAGHTLSINAANIQAADQFSAIFFLAEQWVYNV